MLIKWADFKQFLPFCLKDTKLSPVLPFAGGSVFARNSKKAKELATAVGNGNPPIWHAVGQEPGFRPHWHGQKTIYKSSSRREYEKIKGHIFYF